MEEKGNILLGPVGGLGFGGVVGLAVGYTAKKIGKLVLLAIGAVFILLQALAYTELIDIDWGAVEGAATNAWETSDGTLADRAWQVVTNNLPFGGGFVAGFALGFKMG
ncbi:MAG: FUN14 domain-containing protein [Candidatus Binatia bacterium]|nr:FUN14 domain-containing protein [Candidatus Binatia bacterium]